MTQIHSMQKLYKNKEDFQLKIVVSGENLATVRSTVDDLLACLGAIESTLNSLQ